LNFFLINFIVTVSEFKAEDIEIETKKLSKLSKIDFWKKNEILPKPNFILKLLIQLLNINFQLKCNFLIWEKFSFLFSSVFKPKLPEDMPGEVKVKSNKNDEDKDDEFEDINSSVYLKELVFELKSIYWQSYLKSTEFLNSLVNKTDLLNVEVFKGFKTKFGYDYYYAMSSACELFKSSESFKNYCKLENWLQVEEFSKLF